MVIPARKQDIVEGARKSVLEVERQRLDGAITHGERHNKIIDIWHRATEQVSDEMFSEMRRTEEERGEFNPIRTTCSQFSASGAAALPGRQDPGGLSFAVGCHQRQANRDHLPSDAAVCARDAIGDTDFLVDEQVHRFRFIEENEKVMKRGGEPYARYQRGVCSASKASLSTSHSSPPPRSRRPRGF